MIKSTVITLIGESPEARGVGTDATETSRTVYCTVKSVGQQEVYQAMAVGLNPELKVVIPHDFEYGGESVAELDGVRFRILRTYITEADGIELTLQRIRGNAGEAVINNAE